MRNFNVRWRTWIHNGFFDTYVGNSWEKELYDENEQYSSCSAQLWIKLSDIFLQF